MKAGNPYNLQAAQDWRVSLPGSLAGLWPFQAVFLLGERPSRLIHVFTDYILVEGGGVYWICLVSGIS